MPLEAVKRLGLMYNLQYRAYTDEKPASEDISRTMFQNDDPAESESEGSIICSIDGPLSIIQTH